MGILNATPDSFSDAGELPDLGGAASHGRASSWPRARRCSTSAGSPRPGRAGRRGGGGGRAGRAGHRARRGRARRVVSVDTYKPAVAEAAVAAGAHIVNDVSGLRDPALAAVCARRAPRWWSCTRASRRRGRSSTRATTTTSSRTSAAFLAERMAVAPGAGMAPEQLLLDPGPDFAKTPAQTVAVLRRLDVLHALGRPLLLAVSRKDFVGAITGRGAARAGRRDAGRDRLGGGRRRAAAARARRRRGGRLPRRARRPARRARARAGRGAHARPLPGALRGALACSPHWLPAAAHNAAGSPTNQRRSSHVHRPGSRRARGSPLADLHVIANELGVDGFRRLRKADLVDAIIAKQSGEAVSDAEVEVEAEDEARPRARPSRPRARSRAEAAPDARARPRRRPGGRGRGRGRGGRGRGGRHRRGRAGPFPPRPSRRPGPRPPGRGGPRGRSRAGP